MQEYAWLILSRLDGEPGEHMTGDLAAADKNLADLYRKFSKVAGVQWECCLVIEGWLDPNKRGLEEPLALDHRKLQQSGVLSGWNGLPQDNKTGVRAAPDQGVMIW
jgi:hypothetical protein